MAAARVGHHSNSPFASHSVSRKSTHPVGGSNRHPPDAVSYTTTGHFGQATGAISESTILVCDSNGARFGQPRESGCGTSRKSRSASKRFGRWKRHPLANDLPTCLLVF